MKIFCKNCGAQLNQLPDRAEDHGWAHYFDCICGTKLTFHYGDRQGGADDAYFWSHTPPKPKEDPTI